MTSSKVFLFAIVIIMAKPINSSLINICIIPDDAVSKECARISQSLKDESTMFILGNNLFAHATVYMARFDNLETGNVISELEKILSSTKPFKLQNTGYFLTAGRYVEVSYQKSEDLMKLHESIINAVAQFRINPGNPYEEGYFAPYNQQQKQNAQDTGYDLAYDLYRPHITLTRYNEGEVPTHIPDLPEIDLGFTLGKICVYKADDNGAIYELIKEFQIV